VTVTRRRRNIPFFRWCIILSSAYAQDLSPRAYLVTPVGSNAITFSYSYNNGPVFVDPTIPVENTSGEFQLELLSYYRSFAFFGRSASVTGVLPYAVGEFAGDVSGIHSQVYRSGLADGRLRFSVNLLGGPAMSLPEYRSWHERLTLGASITLSVPTGQYDPARLVNGGENRWGFKPEIGLTRRWGKWMLDCYGGVWVWTANSAFFPGTSVRTQAPVLDAETHFGYYVRPRLWTSLDANFWTGGQSSVDGELKSDRERNSRVGATISIPVTLHHSFKLSYSTGAYVSVGGNYRTVSVAWQYSWFSRIE